MVLILDGVGGASSWHPLGNNLLSSSANWLIPPSYGGIMCSYLTLVAKVCYLIIGNSLCYWKYGMKVGYEMKERPVFSKYIGFHAE